MTHLAAQLERNLHSLCYTPPMLEEGPDEAQLIRVEDIPSIYQLGLNVAYLLALPTIKYPPEN